MDHKTEQDAGLLEQAATMLEERAEEQRARGNDSAAEGAACSAHAIRRLAPALLRAGAAPAAVAGPANDLAELAMLNKLVELGTQAYGALAKSNSDDGPAGTAAYVRWQERRAEMGELIRAHKAPALEASTPVQIQALHRARRALHAIGKTYDDSELRTRALEADEEIDRMLAAAPQEVAAPRDFQQRVHPWLMECFGPAISADKQERNHRFLEEALETVQAGGCTASEAHQLVDYVFGRPVGELGQEVGGAMTTLAALCLANGIDMHAEAEKELARVWTMVEKIRAKQAAKPKHSPLPAAPAAPAVDAGDPALPSWWPDFIQCVAELPDRNSPEDEPDAMIATAEELGSCALAAQAKEGGEA